MGGSCVMFGGALALYRWFWGVNLKERDALEDWCISEDNGEMGLKYVHRMGGGLGGMNLVKDRTKWQGVVNTVMNFQIPQSMGNFLTMRGTVSISRRPVPCDIC